MARWTLNIVVTVGLVLAVSLIHAPYASAKDCRAALDEIHAIQKKLGQKRPSRAGQIKAYEKIQKLLDGCQGASLPSHIQFEIDILRFKVTNRLNKLKHRKAGSPDVPVDCETRYKHCFQMYARHFESIHDMSCDEAATHINCYYDAAWEELKEEGLNEQRVYPPESLDTLWPLLWRISRSDCAKSEAVKTAVRKVFFPHSMEMEEIIEALKAMDPDELARFISSLTKKDPGRFIQFIGAMDHLTTGQRLDLIDEFIAVAKGRDNAQTARIRRLLSNLSTMDEHKLEKAIFLLHKVPWFLDDTNRAAVERIPEDKAAKILALDFSPTDPQTDTDQMFAAKALNNAFQYPYKNSTYQTISVGEKADVVLSGTIDRYREGEFRKYRLHYRFRSQGAEKVILFQDTLTVTTDEATKPETLRKKARLVYEYFFLYIAMMRLMDAAETHAAVSYLKGDKPAAFIQRALKTTTRLFGQAAPDEWESVGHIVVHPEFWRQNSQKAAIILLDTGYREAIMERLETLYYRSYHALVEEEKDKPDTLEVYGENHGPAQDPLPPSDEKKFKLSIIFKINLMPKASTDLYLPQTMIENEPETVKQIIAQIACRSIAVFLNFRPEPLDLKTLASPPKYPLAASFLLPGLWRQGKYKHAGKTPPLKLSAWNYSNLALLSATIGTEAAYIGSDYESDALFWTAVGGTGLFLLNGSIGLIDAWIHHNDMRATAPTRQAKIEIQGAQALGSPALVLSIPF